MSDDFRNEPQPNSTESKLGWQPEEPTAPKKKLSIVKLLLISFCGLLMLFFAAAGVLGILGFALFSVTTTTSVPTTTSAPARQEHMTENYAVAVDESTTVTYSTSETAYFGPGSYSYQGGDVRALTIDVNRANVKVKTHESDDVVVNIVDHSNAGYNVELESFELVIEPLKVLSSYPSSEDEITVWIPEGLNLDTDLSINAGEMSLRGITGDRISLDMKLGDVDFNDIHFNSMEVTMNAGDLEMKDITAGIANFKLSAGDLEMSRFEAGELELTMNAGEVEGRSLELGKLGISVNAGSASLSGNLGNTSANNSAGNLQMTYKSQPQKIRINGNMGSTKIYLPEDSEFRLEHKVTMGNIENDFTTFSDSENLVSATVNAGTVEIRER